MTSAEHVFYNHQLKVTQFTSNLMLGYNVIWPSVLFFLILALVIVVKNSALNNVVKIFKSTTNNQVWQQYLREDGTNIKSHNVILITIYLLCISYFLFKINTYYNLIFTNFTGLGQFLLLFFILLLCLVIKIATNSFIARLTGASEVVVNYQTYSLLINQAFGLIYVPMFIVIEFAGFKVVNLLAICLSLYFISVFIKWVKGTIICIYDSKIGILQTFLYLCALELLPFLVIVKFSIETF